MNGIKYIRKSVFGQNQCAFADMLGVAQSTVSRWERGKVALMFDDMVKIRNIARGRGFWWQDSWFFEAPQGEDECDKTEASRSAG